MNQPTNRVDETDETDLAPGYQPRQRSARTDPGMRDGNNSHGSPSYDDESEITTDTDVGDSTRSAAEETGVLDAVPGLADGGSDEPTLGSGRMTGSSGELPARLRESESADEHRRETAHGDHRAGEVPLEDYKRLTVPQILERIETMSHEQMRAVQRYEESHRRRKTLLVRLERRLRAAKHDARIRPHGPTESTHGRTLPA